MKFFIFIIFFHICIFTYSQIRIYPDRKIDFLVRDVLLENKESIIVKNIKISKQKNMISLFESENIEIFKKGILLSTGNVFAVKGPNDKKDISTRNYLKGDLELNKIVNSETKDAVVLEFDFVPMSDSISFNYFFASEEYPEYVGSNLNDVFAFIITNEELGIKKNLAILPNGEPITINTINKNKNSSFFIENPIFHESFIKSKSNEVYELSRFCQFDGFTKILTAGSKVVPNSTYHIKIAIADVGDYLLDSAVFLIGNSFKNVYKKNKKTNPLKN
ncbi:MAG: hypothetical protein B6I24_05235 [Bacteroidetes bacterium 4572_128]|nr:MAG: hypothetical protein B6I24_05235 [Bacteroidetes bacterium 4572_128]